MKRHISFVLLSVLIISHYPGCKQQNPGLNPKIKHSREKEWRRLITRADREFTKMYWAGWNNAIPLYEHALKIKDDRNIREKLFISLLLIAIREKNFAVRNFDYLKKAEQILPSLGHDTHKIYFNLSKMIVNSPGLSENYNIQNRPGTNNKTVAPNLETLRTQVKTDYQYYFYLRYFEHFSKSDEMDEYNLERDKFSKHFPRSNLNLEIQGGILDLNETLVKYPDFIEMILLQADLLKKSGKYSRAEAKYRLVLDINPRIPAASTEIGSLYFWLELYEQAVVYYDQALAINPNFSKALFGKAICKHYCNEFEISNKILSELIENQTFYHGEAYYFIALNHFHLNNPDDIESNIKKAESYIPDSTDLNAFAGMFYYHQNNLKKSEFHLRKVFEHNIPHGDAHFFLGLIALKKKKPALKIFLTAAECYLADIKNLENKINKVKTIDIAKEYKIKMIKKRKKNLLNTIKISKERLQKIIKIYKRKNKTLESISSILLEINHYYHRFVQAKVETFL